MDLDGFRKNENEKRSGDEKISTEKVDITKSSKVKDQDCNDEDKLGKFICDMCNYKCNKKNSLHKHIKLKHTDHKY